MESLYVSIGLIGVVVVLVAYGLMTTGRIRADEPRYQWLNIVGTAGILLSLIGQWNLPAFIANAAWISIGIFSLIRMRRPSALHAKGSNSSSLTDREDGEKR